jgi:hypothetical protein
LKKVLDIRETAAHIGRSADNTLSMLHTGLIPAIRVDKRWMVSSDVLDKWIICESKQQAFIRHE